MRSWARRILLVATISMALVIFCVLLTLAILVRISLVPAIACLLSTLPVATKFSHDLLQRGLVLPCSTGSALTASRSALWLDLAKRLQRRLEGHDLVAVGTLSM